jgi:hypothetical protein
MMVRYYFDVRDDDGVARDEIGQELDDASAVDGWALAIASDIMRAELAMGTRRLAASVLVRDAGGAVLHELPFGYAIGRISEL